MLLPTASIVPISPAVSLEWDSNPDASAYQVYYGTSSHSYQSLVPVGTNVVTTVGGLSEGTIYYFAVTAVDTFGVESDFSDEIIGQPAARVLVRLGLSGTLQSSTNLFDWSARDSVADADGWDVFINPAHRPNEFFRVVTN